MLNNVWLQGSQMCFLICFSSHIYVFLPFFDILIFLTTLSGKRKKKKTPFSLASLWTIFLKGTKLGVLIRLSATGSECPPSWRAVLGSRCAHTDRNRLYTQHPQQREMEMFAKDICGFHPSRDFQKNTVSGWKTAVYRLSAH